MHQPPETGSSAKWLLLGFMFLSAWLLSAFAAPGCQPPPAGNAAAPAAPPAAPPPPPAPPGAPPAASGPLGVEASAPPAADTPLDTAWRELIAIQEAQFNKLAGVHNASQAEAAVASAVAYHKQRHAALTKIARRGGGKPPAGVPAKLRNEYRAVEDKLLARDEVVSQMIDPARREQLNQQVRQALEADPELATDPFAPSAATPISGDGNIATVTLVNNRSLQGPAHQQMIARLQQLAGASKAEPLIEQDGTYKVVLSPVVDLGSFIRAINFGEVSNRSDAFRTFTLTIDPLRFQAATEQASSSPGSAVGAIVPGGPPGFPPPGSPGAMPTTADQHKAAFFARNGGQEKCAILVLTDAPRPGTPEGMALLAAVKQVAGTQRAADLRVSGQRLILLAPVEDVAALAAKISFGSVTGQDVAKREIYVTIGDAPSNP